MSYLREVPVESRSSDINPHLQVSLIKNRFQLSTEKSIYSFDDLYRNFYRAFGQIELPQSGSKVLVLGLGLASIPYMLEKQFRKDYRYTAVEIDEVVIELASRYTLPRIDSNVQIVHADAEVFVETDQSRYDLIIVDLFLEDVIPPYFNTVEGNEALGTLRAEGGTILYNRLYRTGLDKVGTEDFYYSVFKIVYPEGEALDVGGNWILKA